MSLRIAYSNGCCTDHEERYGDELNTALHHQPHRIDWRRCGIDGVYVARPPLATAIREPYMFFLLKMADTRAMVAAGCRYMSIPDYRAHVAREYPGTHKATQTLRILDFFEQIAREHQCTGLDIQPGTPAQTEGNRRRCPRCAGRIRIYRDENPALTRIMCDEPGPCEWGISEAIRLVDFDAQQAVSLPIAPVDCRPLSDAVRPIPNPAPEPPPLGPYDTEKARRVREMVNHDLVPLHPEIACPRCGNALYVQTSEPGGAPYLVCYQSGNPALPNTCGWGRVALDSLIGALAHTQPPPTPTGRKTRLDAIWEWDEKRAARNPDQYDGLADLIAPPPRTLAEDIMELLNSNPKIERISNRLDRMQELLERLCSHMGVR